MLDCVNDSAEWPADENDTAAEKCFVREAQIVKHDIGNGRNSDYKAYEGDSVDKTAHEWIHLAACFLASTDSRVMSKQVGPA